MVDVFARMGCVPVGKCMLPLPGEAEKLVISQQISSNSQTALQGPNKPRFKICFISPLGYGLYSPQSGLSYGGAEVQFFLLANVLARDPSYDVSVLTTVDHHPGVENHGGLTLVKRLGQGRLNTAVARGVFNHLQRARDYLSAFRDMWREFRRIDADVYLHAGAGVEVGAY